MCQKITSILLLIILHYSAEQDYRLTIDPSTNLTLEKFGSQISDFSRICELILLPGNHDLSSEIRISKHTTNELLVRGMVNTYIHCNESGRFEFEDFNSLRLMNLILIDCENVTITSIEQTSIENCTFYNEASSTTVLFFKGVRNSSIINGSFTARNNESTNTVFIRSYHSNISLSECVFTTELGRVLLAEERSHVNITNTIFCNSNVTNEGDHPALIKVSNSSIKMIGSCVRNNNGSLIMSARNCVSIQISNSSFVNNTAWECTLCVSKSNLTLQLTNIISDNCGKFSVIYLVKTVINITNGVHYAMNDGSFLVRNSKITFNGMNTFEKCSQSNGNASSGNYHATGTLTAIQSTIIFIGTTHFVENYSDMSGGALYLLESMMQVQGELVVVNNFAQSGGGAFLYLSQVIITGTSSFIGNRANSTGGAIHAVSTAVTLGNFYSQWEYLRSESDVTSFLNVSDNEACSGGGLYLEANSKLYATESTNFKYSMEFARNKAIDKGGAIYVNDSTYLGVCASTSFDNYDVQTECFFQALHDDEDCEKCQLTQNINFTENSAEHGSILYGGLLDRCTVNFQASVYNTTFHSTAHSPVDPVYGLSYFQNEGGINSSLDPGSISSDVLRVCFCQGTDLVSCDYEPPAFNVQKGKKFNITIAAVNQVNKTFSNITIRSYLKVREESKSLVLVTGQLSDTSDGCTNITYNIHSDQNSVELALYVNDNPCEDSGLSRSAVTVNFIDCTCPTGFQDSTRNDCCDCICHEKIRSHVQMCNATNGTFQKIRNSWIGYCNESNNIGYLIYSNCPYDFCCAPTSPNNFINLNLPHGADVQCAYDRAGLLCGQCKQGLQISLGTPRCIDCRNSTIAMYFVEFFVGGINGVVLIVLLLVLNLTVAQGTINGVIFYANILLMSRSTFFSSMSPNFFTVSIHLLNTQLGFDRCYHGPGAMDEYLKMWHRLMFPLYMLFLVVGVIFVSNYSSKCSYILGKKNPVATLATVILLVYTEVLQVAMDALSFAILEYPDGSHRVLWRPDGSLGYLKGKHIPLFLVGAVILIVGTVYTLLLFVWQWLTRAHNKYIFRWMRNTKINSFVDAYHAPYKPKYRYWTGLLLLARMLFNVAVTSNSLSNPHYKLLTIVVLTASLILLKACLGDHIYKQRFVDYIEMICYFNLLLLSLASLKIIGNPKYHEISTCVSVSVTLLITLCVLLYHIYSFLYKTNIKRMSTRVVNWLHRRRENNVYTAKYKLTHKNNVSSTEVSLSDFRKCSDEHTTSISSSSVSNLKLAVYSLREPLLDDS